ALLAPVRGVEVVPLDGHAVGRVAVTGQRSRVDVPGLDNSQMDGFALAATDLAGTGEAVTLPLGPTIAAGDAPGTLAPGTARPIMTGAPIPAGADLVVPVEESAAGRFDPAGGEDAAAEVTLAPTSVASGRFVRRLVLATGTEVSTAEESALQPGSLFDADGPGLAAALTEAGAEVVHVGAVPDDADVLLEHVRAQVLAHDADLVITSGGVSMGAFEGVRHAASREGAMLAFAKVAVQPGGPQGIGTLAVGDRRVPWLAFPGNPVSALLSCELIARPALGAPSRRRLRLPLQLEAEETSPPALEQYR